LYFSGWHLQEITGDEGVAFLCILRHLTTDYNENTTSQSNLGIGCVARMLYGKTYVFWVKYKTI